MPRAIAQKKNGADSARIPIVARSVRGHRDAGAAHSR